MPHGSGCIQVLIEQRTGVVATCALRQMVFHLAESVDQHARMSRKKRERRERKTDKVSLAYGLFTRYVTA